MKFRGRSSGAQGKCDKEWDAKFFFPILKCGQGFYLLRGVVVAIDLRFLHQVIEENHSSTCQVRYSMFVDVLFGQAHSSVEILGDFLNTRKKRWLDGDDSEDSLPYIVPLTLCGLCPEAGISLLLHKQ